jgi:hypothetical protein
MALPNSAGGALDAEIKVVESFTTSIGASPVVAVARAPHRGRLEKFGVVTAGTITVANATLTMSVNGTNVTGGTATVLQSGAAAGQHFSSRVSGTGPSAATPANGFVFEDDVIAWTFSGASGASIPAYVYAHVRKN